MFMNDNIFLNKTQPVLMNQKQAAAYLGTTVGTLNVLRQKGKCSFPFLRWGRSIRYRKEDLDQWIQDNLINKTNSQSQTNA